MPNKLIPEPSTEQPGFDYDHVDIYFEKDDGKWEFFCSLADVVGIQYLRPPSWCASGKWDWVFYCADGRPVE